MTAQMLEYRDKGRGMSLSFSIFSAILADLSLTFVLPAFFSSCTVETALKRELAETVLEVKSAGSESVESLDIFFFNDDELQRLDSYQRIEEFGNSSVKATSRYGDKIIAVLANSSADRYTWSVVNSYSGLKGIQMDLQNEDLSCPVMAGECRTVTGKEADGNITLDALLAEVVLESISCDFSGREYPASVLTDVKVYLTNVTGLCPLLPDEDFRPAVILNLGKYSEGDSAGFLMDNLLYSEVASSLGSKILRPDIHLYCYANTVAEESLGNPFTRLVVEGKMDGITYYYPLNINREGFGYTSGVQGIERGRKYIFNLTITRTGSKDPDTPVATGVVDVNFTIGNWKEEGEDVISY